jgi:hypothetical protein
MKLNEEFRWVNETDVNLPLQITGLNVTQKDKILLLRKDLELLQMSIYGKNFNFLYNTLGNESDDWIGKHIIFKQEVINGKNVRIITSAK